MSEKDAKEPQTIADRTLAEIKSIEKTWPLIRAASWSLCRRHPLLTLLLVCIFAFVGWDYFFGLRSKNKELSTQLNNTQSELRDTKADLAPFKTAAVLKYGQNDRETLKRLAETMTALHKDYSNALNTISVLQAEVKETKRKTDRSVSSETEAELVGFFTTLPKAKIGIKCYDTASEGRRFAKQLTDIFIRSGFTTTNYAMDGGFDMNMGMRAGHYMTVNSAQQQPLCAGPIQKALEQAGVEMPGQFHPNLAANEIEFVIMRISR